MFERLRTLWRVNPRQQLNTSQPLSHSPPQQWETWERTGEARKHMGRDKDSLISEEKREKHQVDAQPFSEQQLLSRPKPPPPAPSIFYCQAWCYITWNIPVVNLGQLSQSCPLPPQPTRQGSRTGKRETLTLGNGCSARAKTPVWYQQF